MPLSSIRPIGLAVVLLVQAHGRTGAETAGLAGVLLRRAVEVR